MVSAARVAVVTGAGSGIGRALAQVLDGRGYQLVLCDVNGPGLDETKALLSRPASGHVVDVADRAAVYAFAESAIAAHGQVDLVINNAGVDLAQPLSTVSQEDFEWIFGINFWGVVHGTRAFLGPMLARGSGVVVNVSSVFGLIGWPMHGTYCASKFAVRGFTETLRHELVGTGVRAVCVHPGGIKTNIVKNSRFRNDVGVANRDEAAAFFDRIARTSALEAAEVIVRGVEKGKQRILIGADAHLIDHVQRTLPESHYRVFAKFTPSRERAS
jgi:NAD(P)-dependent dehydrogenase (short-subunit alcohol dehydrogenase family)